MTAVASSARCLTGRVGQKSCEFAALLNNLIAESARELNNNDSNSDQNDMKPQCAVPKTTLFVLLITLGVSLGLGPAAAQNPGDQGSPPRDGPRRPGGGGPRGGRPGGAAFQSAPIPKDDAEKKILQVLEDMRQGGLGISAPRDDARLLRLLIESTGAKHAVELGTFHGYSSIWMSLGLRTTGGKLTTFEIDKENAELSRQNFKRAGVDSVVTVVEGDAHQEARKLKEPIDFIFIDADKQGYLDYLNILLPLVRPGGLIVAHNITPGMADPAFIKSITTNASLESLFINAGNDGMSLSMKKR